MGDHLKYKQVRLNPDVRELLDAYKMDGESYSIAIGRLFKENEQLKKSQELLMKMAMKTDNSIALPTDWHRIAFVIQMMSCYFDFESDDERIGFFKTILGDSLENNPTKTYYLIEDFINEFPDQEETFAPILEWMMESFEIGEKSEGNDDK